MKGFIIKNIRTGKVYTGKGKTVPNPSFNSKANWIVPPSNGFFNYQPYGGYNKKEKVVTEEEMAKYPLFYKKNSWSGALEEYITPFGSDGTSGPPWLETIPNYWGTEPKVFATKKATEKILSIITKTYARDRENETTALLYLPDCVHDYKVIQVEVIIKEVEDGTGIATTTSESKQTTGVSE